MFYAAITPLLPRYSDELGLSKSAAGMLTAAYPAGTLLASLPSGWLAVRVGVRPTVLLGLGLLSVSSVVFGLAENVVAA
jgi:ACDE family multidrug resistance protein